MACSSSSSGSAGPTATTGACTWDEASDFRDPTQPQLATIDRIQSRLSTELSRKEQGYLVGLRYQAVPNDRLARDPVVRKARAIMATEVAACSVATTPAATTTRTIGTVALALGAYCDKPFWQNLGECWAVEPPSCKGKTLCCSAWAGAVSAGYGCDPQPEQKPNDGDQPVDPEAYDASPQNLDCDPPCHDGKTCSAGACSCPSASPVSCASGCSNPAVDPYNCGECGHVCAIDERCMSGTCVKSSPSDAGTDSGAPGKCTSAADNGACESKLPLPPPVDVVYVPGASPPPVYGGTILEGNYVLVDMTTNTDPGSNKQTAASIAVCGNVIEFNGVPKSGTMSAQWTFETTGGTTFISTKLCTTSSDYGHRDTELYTANGDDFYYLYSFNEAWWYSHFKRQ